MKHLNSNVLAVVDTETTGADPDKHDIIEFAIVILDKFLVPDKQFLPLNLRIQPTRIRNIDQEALRIQGKVMGDLVGEKLCKNREHALESAISGLHPEQAEDLFDKWFTKLGMAPRKRIMPVACNWSFDREFIARWLGREAFYHYFDPRYRDVMSMSLYDNDIADWRGEAFPYAKNNLQWLCTCMGVERTRSHNALDDCLATAEVYRKMIQRTEIRNLPRAPEDGKGD